MDLMLLWEFVKNVPTEFLMGLKDGALRVQGAARSGTTSLWLNLL